MVEKRWEKGTGLVLFVAVLWSCEGDNLERVAQSLDENGNGICDFSERSKPTPTVVQAGELREAPIELELAVKLGTDVKAPGRGRIAWLAYAWVGTGKIVEVELPDGEILQVPEGKIELHELFGAVLPVELPAVIHFRVDQVPVDLLARLPGDSMGKRLVGDLVIYDDRDGDGRAGLGKSYGRPEPPHGVASQKDFARFAAELAAWEHTYGRVDFLTLSAPADPANEIVARTPIEVSYYQDSWLPYNQVPVTGFALGLTTTACEEYHHKNPNGSEWGCAACGTHREPLDFSKIQSVAIGWDLAMR